MFWLSRKKTIHVNTKYSSNMTKFPVRHNTPETVLVITVPMTYYMKGDSFTGFVTLIKYLVCAGSLQSISFFMWENTQRLWEEATWGFGF